MIPTSSIRRGRTGTGFADDGETFVLATPLSAGDVGVGAPDQLCPNGPQN